MKSIEVVYFHMYFMDISVILFSHIIYFILPFCKKYKFLIEKKRVLELDITSNNVVIKI